MPTFVHGKKTNLLVADASTTYRNLRPYLTGCSMPRSVDTAETTVFDSSDKTHLPGSRGGTISMTGLWSSTVDGWLAGIVGKTKGWKYYPNTTAAGIHYMGSAIVNSYEVSASNDAAIPFSAEMTVTGLVTRSTT